MHVPAVYRITDRQVLEDFIASQGFGILVTAQSATPAGDHLPFILEGERLYSHMNRANPTAESLEGEALVIFAGPHSYISPRWYKSGKVIPTWNYMAVHVTGRLRRLSDEENVENLRRLVSAYEDLNSAPFAGMFEDPRILRTGAGTTGFVVEIDSIIGQFKLSQDKPAEDQSSVIEHLRTSGRPMDLMVAEAMQSQQTQ